MWLASCRGGVEQWLQGVVSGESDSHTWPHHPITSDLLKLLLGGEEAAGKLEKKRRLKSSTLLPSGPSLPQCRQIWLKYVNTGLFKEKSQLWCNVLSSFPKITFLDFWRNMRWRKAVVDSDTWGKEKQDLLCSKFPKFKPESLRYRCRFYRWTAWWKTRGWNKRMKFHSHTGQMVVIRHVSVRRVEL